MDPEHPIEIGGDESSREKGKIPSNPIITSTIEEIKKRTEDISTSGLSPTGQAIFRDISQSLEDSERLVEEKNRDELFQRIASCVQEITRLQGTDTGKSALTKLGQREKKEGQTIVRIIQEKGNLAKVADLLKTMLTGSDLRNLLFEIVSLGQHVAAQLSESEEVQLTDEQLDKINDRFIALMQRLQQNSSYQESITSLQQGLWYLTNTVSVANDTWEDLEVEERKIMEEIKNNVMEAGNNMKKLIEAFSNTSTNDVEITFNDIQRDLVHDEEAHQVLAECSQWWEKCLRDADYLKDRQKVREDANHMIEIMKTQIVAKYRPRMEQLLGQIRYLLDRMRRDPLARKLSGDMSTLTQHLFYDRQGNPTLKPELLTDLQVVLPAILRTLRYIKLPDIEVHDPGLDFVATDVVINVGEVAPHYLRLVVTADIPEEEGQAGQNTIEFEMSRIHAEARNIRFAVNKSGIPPLMDSGLADFRIYEDGMQINLTLQPVFGTTIGPTDTKAIKAGLQVNQCSCKLEYFDLSVHGSGHDWMYYLLGPYIRRLVKEKIEEAVQDYFMKIDLLSSLAIPTATASEGVSTESVEVKQ